jgi:hypothetical protein
MCVLLTVTWTKHRLTYAIAWVTTKLVQSDVIARRTNTLHLNSPHQLRGTQPSKSESLLLILSFEWFSGIPFLLLYLLTHAYQQNMKTQMFATNDYKIHRTSVKYVWEFTCSTSCIKQNVILTQKTTKCALINYKNTNNIPFVFLHDTVMVAEVIETCRWIVIYDKTYRINVHLVVSYVKYKIHVHL